VLDELRDDDAVRLVLVGGVLRRNHQSVVGTLTESGLRQVSADLAFLSCTGVRANGHVVDDMAVEAPIKQAMVESAPRVVLIAGEAQFPGTGSLRLCSLADIDVLFARNLAELDSVLPSHPYREYLRAQARSACTNDRNSDDQYGLTRTGPFDSAGVGRQESAVSLLTAVL